MITLKAKDDGEELPRCIASFNRIPTESLNIRDSNAVHLGKKFFAQILSVIIYYSIVTLNLSVLDFVETGSSHRQRLEGSAGGAMSPQDGMDLDHTPYFRKCPLKHPKSCFPQFLYGPSVHSASLQMCASLHPSIMSKSERILWMYQSEPLVPN